MLVLCRFKEYLVVFVMMMIIIMNCFRRMVDKAVTEAATRGVQLEKVFLEILQNSQERIYPRVSLLKKKLWHRCFTVNFVTFLRTPFCIKHLRWVLLLLHLIFTWDR